MADVAKAALLNDFQFVISPILFNEKELRRELVIGLELSDDFMNAYFGAIPEPERTRERIQSEWGSIRDRVNGSSLEEIVQCSIEIATNLERNDPSTYYGAATKAYREVAQALGEFSKGVHFFMTVVRPLLQSNDGYLKAHDLERLIPKDKLMDAIWDLPIPLRKQILEEREFITGDIDRMNFLLQEYDAKRNALHKKILAYAKAHFGKDYLNVYIDIMRGDTFPVESYSTLDSTGKGSVTFTIGVLDLESTSRIEFSRYYGQELDKWYVSAIDTGYHALEEARREAGLGFRRKPEYKSVVKSGRTEEEDNAILEQIAAAYPEYVIFKGDYLIKNIHGHYVYAKLIEISVDRIREKEKNPTVRIQQIRDYIESLLPKVWTR